MEDDIMVNMSLFLFGALGAILTVYLAKQEVIPEFRPLFDTADIENEAKEHKEHISNTEKEIDNIQARLREESVDSDLTKRLTIVLETSLSELKAERLRLQTLERDIRNHQIILRGLGFLFYICLGGVFGAMLAGRTTVEGLNANLSIHFQSIVIGATWTSYLSTIGFRSVQEKADDRIEAGEKKLRNTIEAVKKDLIQKISEKLEDAEKAVGKEQPILAEVTNMVAGELDRANMSMQMQMDATRAMVKRDVKGLL
ncbi:MAG: hypothetical protein ACE5J5_00220 [Candidatus Hydrothermarchaeales archaeon]